MLLKRTLFAVFIAFSLLALCLNATPVPRCSSKASVNLMDTLGGNVTFEQTRELIVTLGGRFSENIETNNPDDYFIQIGEEITSTFSFRKMDVEIKPPGTSHFSYPLYGRLGLYAGRDLKR
ncbi:3146_t:CDS:2 [Acaulospora colombiana]|uniref:3146_t:CDS:1 n=1 Tax=Acaulospora colombiana TaxID=27376 RepID=A0ACA9LWZ6_9GLOM|nr:3146_t:CDS:2 [Acaulospora colombiana]